MSGRATEAASDLLAACMQSRLSRRRILVAGVASWAGTCLAQPPAADGLRPERVTVRDGDATRSVAGTVVVEAADGGLLLERPDQRFEVLQPADIVAREPIAALDAPATPRDLGLRVLAELPAGFDLHVTRHYVVCFDTSRDYARWAASLFERLQEAFCTYWNHAGLKVTAPTHPLIVLVFGTSEAYERYAVRDLGAAAGAVVGYYNLLSNRVATYDLTGSDALRSARAGGVRRGAAEILARPEAAGLVATVVHEATHQMAFNCGLHARLAPVPVWVSEGIATYFETPDLRSRTGWRGIGGVNHHRLERFRETYHPGDLEAVIRSDDRFRDVGTAPDAYAVAWSLTWFLVETRRPRLVRYLQRLAMKRPFDSDGPEQRVRDFEIAFEEPPAALEPAFLRHMDRLERRRP